MLEPHSMEGSSGVELAETDGVRGGAGAATDAAPTVLGAWEGLRVVRFRSGPLELPERHLPHHLVTLNLGAATTCESNFERRGWQTHATPRDGIGVFPAHVRFAARTQHPIDALTIEIRAGDGAPLRPVVGAQDPAAAHMILALAEEARLGGARSGSLVAESLATALLAHLGRRGDRLRPAGGAVLANGRLRRVLDHVAAHLEAPLSLRELAHLAEMDVFRFVRAFKQATGVPPHRYLMQARVDRAKALLADGRLSISDVALRTGFGTPSHFSTVFRRMTSQSPRAYRGALP